jgi:hypothetical protein
LYYNILIFFVVGQAVSPVTAGVCRRFGCGYAALYYSPSVSSRAATIFRAVGQAILPAAAFQAALGCGYAAMRGSFSSCSADFSGALRGALVSPPTRHRI